MNCSSFVFAWPRVGNSLLKKTVRTPWVIGRGVILALCSLTLGYACVLRLMPALWEKPFRLCICFQSWSCCWQFPFRLYREQVSRVGWSLAILGFLGVLMILRPGGGLDSVGVVLALLNAGLAAVFHLITRNSYQNRIKSFPLVSCHLGWCGLLRIGSNTKFRSPPSQLEGFGTDGLAWVDFDLGALSLHSCLSIRSCFFDRACQLHAFGLGSTTELGFLQSPPDQWTLLGMLMIVIAGAGIAIKTHLDKMRQPA